MQKKKNASAARRRFSAILEKPGGVVKMTPPPTGRRLTDIDISQHTAQPFEKSWWSRGFGDSARCWFSWSLKVLYKHGIKNWDMRSQSSQNQECTFCGHPINMSSLMPWHTNIQRGLTTNHINMKCWLWGFYSSIRKVVSWPKCTE